MCYKDQYVDINLFIYIFPTDPPHRAQWTGKWQEETGNGHRQQNNFGKSCGVGYCVQHRKS